jgi:hypothetical protein
MSTISARGDRIMGTPPEAVAIPSPTTLIVTFPARFGGNEHNNFDEDNSVPSAFVCMPSRQNKSEPMKLLPCTVTVTAVISGAMLGLIPKICNNGMTSNPTAWVDVSTRASSETSICTFPTCSAGRTHLKKVVVSKVDNTLSSESLILHLLVPEKPSPTTVIMLG